MKMKIRTTRKRLLSVLLAAAMALVALPLTALPAVAATSGDFEYAVLSEADKTCAITDYTGSATALTIPSELDGYTVTGIGGDAFNGCASLTSITIPNSVTSVGWYAFKDCVALTSVTIPNSVKSIEEGAFSGCTLLTTIYGYTGSYAETFANTNGYTFVVLPSGIQDGNVNGDDKINAVDARWILQVASGARTL